jgi:GxxExxY protein
VDAGADIETIASMTVDAGLKVHRTLGPGLLESAYEHCLAHELSLRGAKVDRQVFLPIIYEGVTIEAGYRVDLLVGSLLIVEIKAVDQIAPIHTAQLLTYLKLSDLRLGLLMNFNVPLFKSGVRRVIN